WRRGYPCSSWPSPATSSGSPGCARSCCATRRPSPSSMPTFSHSRLSVYETCPRQYRFRYVERIKLPRIRTAELSRGSQVHVALETLYRGIQRGRRPPLDEILDGYRRAWQEQWAPEILISDPSMTPEDFLRQGEQDLVGYYARYRPFDADRTVE